MSSFGIGRITPAGVFEQVQIPDPAVLKGVSGGPDGNLWVIEEDGRIWRVMPTGAITGMFPQFRLRGRPVGITAGPDGNYAPFQR
jgi:streptogramin lyase